MHFRSFYMIFFFLMCLKNPQTNRWIQIWIHMKESVYARVWPTYSQETTLICVNASNNCKISVGGKERLIRKKKKEVSRNVFCTGRNEFDSGR